MKMLRATIVAVCAVAIGCLAMLVSQNLSTLIFVKRLLSSGDPAAPVQELAALVQVLPRGQDRQPVVIAVPGKMGTTWVGHIAHQLLTGGGDLDFSRNLMMDSPYPEFGEVMLGSKLSLLDPPYWKRSPFADSVVTVRTHATHANLRKVGASEQEGFRLVTVFRDPHDTLLSSHKFVTSLVGMESSQVPISHFAKLLHLAGEFHYLYAHYVDFWQRRNHPDVLLLFFDDLKEELGLNVRRLAKHLGVGEDPDVLAKVTLQSSQEWMSDPKRSERFVVPRQVRADMMSKIGLTEADMLENTTRIVGKKGPRSKDGVTGLPETAKRMLQAVWDEVVLPGTNCTSVDDMRLKFRTERAHELE